MKDLWIKFIQTYQEDVLRFSFYLCRHEQLAEDLSQETFLKAMMADLPQVKNAKPYLFQISKNLFIDLQRKKRHELDHAAHQLQAPSVNPAELEVWSVLFSLDQSDQDVLMLVDREGLSLFEASHVLGISEGALKSRLIRARENYQKKWNR